MITKSHIPMTSGVHKPSQTKHNGSKQDATNKPKRSRSKKKKKSAPKSESHSIPPRANSPVHKKPAQSSKEPAPASKAGKPAIDLYESRKHLHDFSINLNALITQRDSARRTVDDLEAGQVRLEATLAIASQQRKAATLKWARMTSRRGKNAAGRTTQAEEKRSAEEEAKRRATMTADLRNVERECDYVADKIRQASAERDALRSVMVGLDEGSVAKVDRKPGDTNSEESDDVIIIE